jgi:hypothetical protein
MLLQRNQNKTLCCADVYFTLTLHKLSCSSLLNIHSYNNNTNHTVRCESRLYFYRAAMETCHTRITLSVYPANSVCPSEDQARLMHCGGSARPEVVEITSGFSSSTTILPSKSCYKKKKFFSDLIEPNIFLIPCLDSGLKENHMQDG